jgi:hypothetical protein
MKLLPVTTTAVVEPAVFEFEIAHTPGCVATAAKSQFPAASVPAFAGATDVRTPSPSDATATSATRLKFVFVDMFFLSLVEIGHFPISARRSCGSSNMYFVTTRVMQRKTN